MIAYKEPVWLTEARKHIGMREVPGAASNSWIKEMWLSLKGGLWFWTTYGEDDSKLPWCGAFCAFVMKTARVDYPKNYASAKAWLDWGTKLYTPEVGCIVVFEREGGGHVGFLVGRDENLRYLVLGGNQGDEANIRSFGPERSIGFRWPPGVPLPPANPLPIYAAAQISTREA